jgi:hypothetical protein
MKRLVYTMSTVGYPKHKIMVNVNVNGLEIKNGRDKTDGRGWSFSRSCRKIHSIWAP